MAEEFELFVPGRNCLFGEHSDWAGGHRRQNSGLEKGYAIVAQTNQGIYAKVKRRDDKKLVVKSTLDNKVFEIELEKKGLRKRAEEGGIFSYVSGVAYYIIDNYDNEHIRGLEIDNYKTTLPAKKGLSSSAAICVLTARAFNKLYALKLKPEDEMELAYKGEILTPSRCGRMDQACAFSNPVLMTFDGDFIETEELKVGNDINLVIVDLHKGKDTKKILGALHKSFPFAINEEDSKVQYYLGEINKNIIFDARNAIREGDNCKIGALMRTTQELFDYYLMNKCEELIAPKLHSVIKYCKDSRLVYGGKGIGSGGDGCAQFVAKGKEEQQELIRVLDNSDFDVSCYELDIKRNI